MCLAGNAEVITENLFITCQIAASAVINHVAPIKDQGSVSYFQHLLGVLFDDYRGKSFASNNTRQSTEELLHNNWRQAFSGLVEQEKPRIENERPRNR